MQISIFVRSLTDYCSHQSLKGKEIDISEVENGNEIREKIQEYLKERTTATKELHEEFAIHEYFGISDQGEYPDLDKLAEIVTLIREHNLNPFVVTSYIAHNGNLDYFQDSFVGIYSSEEAFAEEYIKERHDFSGLETEWGNLFEYLDWERLARNLFINDYFSVEYHTKDYDKEVAVFGLIGRTVLV